MKRSHPVTRLIMIVVLLALVVIAVLEFSRRGTWNRAYKALEEARQSIPALGGGLDRKEKIRAAMEAEYGAELVEGVVGDYFFFSGVLRTYWVEVRYNALDQPVHVDFGVTSGLGSGMPDVNAIE